MTDYETTLLPKDLVEKFLNEFLIRHPRSFAILRSEVITHSLNTRGLKDLVKAGAAGFELIVGTTQSPKQVIDWLGDHRYQFGEKQSVERGQLFDGMFPIESVDLALHKLSLVGHGALIGFAHDADPIWILG